MSGMLTRTELQGWGLTNSSSGGYSYEDFESDISAYFQTNGLFNDVAAMQSTLDGITPRVGTIETALEAVRAEIALLEKNPPVGSLTRYAGFEWLVVHWDTGNSVMYLALKDIYRLTCYSETTTPGHPNVGFKDSVMEAEVFDFEAELRSRMRAASSTQAALSDMTSPLLNSDLSLLEDTEYDGITCKVFIPTRDQMTSVFELFKTASSDETHGNFANAIALYNGEPMDWWLADNAVSALKPYVMKNGRYNKSTGTTQLIGFRPFVRMKMR